MLLNLVPKIKYHTSFYRVLHTLDVAADINKTATKHQIEDNTNPKNLANPEEHHPHQRGPHRPATKAPDGHRPHTDLRRQGEQPHHPAAAQAGTEHPDTEMNHHAAAAPEGTHPRDAANNQKTSHLENTAQKRPQNQNATKNHQEDVTTIAHHPHVENTTAEDKIDPDPHTEQAMTTEDTTPETPQTTAEDTIDPDPHTEQATTTEATTPETFRAHQVGTVHPLPPTGHIEVNGWMKTGT